MSETSVKIMECALVESGVLTINRIGVGVGVILYNPAQKKAAGMHILAPNTNEATPANPAKFANTAIPHALGELEKQGIKAPFTVAVAGGAEMQNMPPQVRMGQKVVTAITEALGKARLVAKDKQTGGANIRSMECDLDTGRIKIV